MTREEAIQELEFILIGHTETSARGRAVLMAIEALQEQRPTGHWLKPTALSEPICSVCLSAPKLLFGKTSAWCPNCGAKMDGE